MRRSTWRSSKWFLAGAAALCAVACALPEYEKSNRSPYANGGAAGVRAGAGGTESSEGGGGPSDPAGGTAGSSVVHAAGQPSTAGSAGVTGNAGAPGMAGAGGSAPTCNDGLRNQDETDIDCGGSCEATCADGEGCVDHDDCTSGICAGQACRCNSGDRRCDGNQPQLCSDAGVWEDESDCPEAAPSCSLGECVPISCEGGLQCGPDGSMTSCCEARLVPTGTFAMGRSESGSDAFTSGGADEQPEHDATVSGYSLDKYPVTVGRFRRFVESYSASAPAPGEGANPLIPGSGWDPSWDANLPADADELMAALGCDGTYHTWSNTPGSEESAPINCVSWFEAFAFCIWDGGRLPTEAEWEYAAAGGDENRLYPWGADAPTADHANYFSGAGSQSVPVGSTPLGDGRWGHSDLAGGVYEWVLDWYSADWYADTLDGCDDCANLTTASGRVLRGGHWVSEGYDLRACNRLDQLPTARDSGIGIRCARDAP